MHNLFIVLYDIKKNYDPSIGFPPLSHMRVKKLRKINMSVLLTVTEASKYFIGLSLVFRISPQTI